MVKVLFGFGLLLLILLLVPFGLGLEVIYHRLSLLFQILLFYDLALLQRTLWLHILKITVDEVKSVFYLWIFLLQFLGLLVILIFVRNLVFLNLFVIKVIKAILWYHFALLLVALVALGVHRFN